MPVSRQHNSILFTTFIRYFSVFSLGAFRFFESKLGHLSNKKPAIPVFAKDCGFDDTTRGRPHPIALRLRSLSWASLAERVPSAHFVPCGNSTRGRPHPIALRLRSLSWASLTDDSLTVQSAPSACFHRANHSHSLAEFCS